MSDARAPPASWLGGSTRGLQPVGRVQKEAVHLLSLQPASITSTSSSAFKPECNGLSQFIQDTGGPSMPVQEFNLIACPLVQSSWKKTPLQTIGYQKCTFMYTCPESLPRNVGDSSEWGLIESTCGMMSITIHCRPKMLCVLGDVPTAQRTGGEVHLSEYASLQSANE